MSERSQEARSAARVCAACGAWSVAIASIVPSRTAHVEKQAARDASNKFPTELPLLDEVIEELTNDA